MKKILGDFLPFQICPKSDLKMKKKVSVNRGKIFSLVIISVLLSIILINFVFASDVAYLYVRKFNVDNNIVNLFKDMGFTVDFIQEKDFATTDFSQYRFIFVGDERFSKPNLIPITKFPSVITNYNNGPDFGLTDSDGISSLGRDEIMSITVNDSVIPVYTQGVYSNSNQVAIPYFYLGKNDKAPQLIHVVGTYSGSTNNHDLGDVISYGAPGTYLQNGKITEANICFFGIVASDYWTDDAKQMFNDCVAFVSSKCSQDSDCGTNETGDNYCIGKGIYDNVTHFICVNPGKANSECEAQTDVEPVRNCSDLCIGGMCEVSPCHNDSECGNNSFIGNLFCQNNNVFQNYITYKCNSPGTINATCTNTTSMVMNISCNPNQLCSNGSCFTVCKKDSDCGQNGLVGGLVCQNNSVVQNFITYTCNNPGTLLSVCTNTTTSIVNQTCGVSSCNNPGASYCKNGNVYQNQSCVNQGCSTGSCFSKNNFSETLIQTCSIGCSKGSCIVPNCTNDLQCDDGSIYTVDVCNNPGTVSSYCTHNQINCANNNDCGLTGFTGKEFCSSGNVFKVFQNSTCVNPGTVNSYCSTIKNSQLIVDCGQSSCGDFGSNYCKNGSVYRSRSCINKGCDSGSCISNVSSDEQLVQPCANGCSNGECTRIPMVVACSQNSDCGMNGFVGTTFCSGTSVFQNFISYTCINPGSENSYCLNSTAAQQKQICSQNQICSNGICVDQMINCSMDSQCNDNNPYTFDQCINPATPYSYCNHVAIACSSNSDCGDNELIGSHFCMNGNVFQNFYTFTCNNPGKIGAYCSNSTSPQLLQTCSSGQTCNNGSCVSVTCSQNSDCGQSGFIDGLFCQNGNVYQNFKTYNCNNAGTSTSSCSSSIQAQLKQTCSSNQVCSNGMCTNVNIACYQNSDCGTNGFIGSPFCSGTSVFQNFVTYTCNNPGTQMSSCSASSMPQLKQTCDQSQQCSNGACLNPTPSPVCNESCNCGISGFIGNPICQNNNVYQNYVNFNCNNQGSCHTSCSNTTSLILKETCGSNQQCSNGQCQNVQIACTCDSDCGQSGFVDGLFCQSGNVYRNFKTFTCANPNTPQSSCSSSTVAQLKQTCSSNQVCSNGMCTNVNIACYQNSDCGTNGFIGSPFCSGTSVFQNFVTYTCNNPGTQMSSCSASSMPQLKQTCDQSQQCSNGACLNPTPSPVCNESCNCGISGFIGNPICQNNNVYQNYVNFNCNNQGSCHTSCSNTTSLILKETCGSNQQCSNGQCQNVQIACTCDSDCGQSGFVDGLFCQSGNVYRNFKTFTCANPNTPQSSCSSSTVAQLKQTCSQGQTCTNGACTSVNKNCSEALANPMMTYNLRFSTISSNLNSDTNYTVISKIENLANYPQTIKYQTWMCRCSQHLGDPIIPSMGHVVCDDYYPFSDSSQGCYKTDITTTLNPNQIIIVPISVSQYNNQMCGSYQTDINLISVNGKLVDNNQPLILSGAAIDLCNDCSQYH